jgi:hypothetical protein
MLLDIKVNKKNIEDMMNTPKLFNEFKKLGEYNLTFV